MRSGRVMVVVIAAALLWGVISTGYSAEKDAKDRQSENIWTAPPPDTRGYLRLTDEEIARIMKRIKETDPQKAQELEQLRQTTDEEAFHDRLRQYGKDEFAKIVTERIESYRQRRRAEFLDWLAKNYPREATELKKIRPKNPSLYNKKYDLARAKYGYIYDAWRRNPELGKVLKEDLRLKERRDSLIAGIKAEKDEKKRNELAAQLQHVISDRFDLIVRRKQIALDQLLKRVEELKKQIDKGRLDIRAWRDSNFKQENVKKRVKELTEGIPKLRFDWD